MNNIDCKANKSNGFILLSTSLGIFVVLSFFAFYLARFSSREIAANTNYLNDIRASNLAQTGLEHGIQLLKTSILSLFGIVTIRSPTIDKKTMKIQDLANTPLHNATFPRTGL